MACSADGSTLVSSCSWGCPGAAQLALFLSLSPVRGCLLGGQATPPHLAPIEAPAHSPAAAIGEGWLTLHVCVSWLVSLRPGVLSLSLLVPGECTLGLREGGSRPSLLGMGVLFQGFLHPVEGCPPFQKGIPSSVKFYPHPL